jgi:hypothetical protein
MPRVGFEPTIPVFEPSKIFRVLDRAATVTGSFILIALYDMKRDLSRREGHTYIEGVLKTKP